MGFEKLGAGSDIQATIDEMSTQINNDAINRDDLLKRIDELSGVMVPELEYEAGEWVVPLIQAGSWLEGAHLVSMPSKQSLSLTLPTSFSSSLPLWITS